MSVHFSSERLNWKTPKAVYQVLDAEFQFDHDPCPLNPQTDGLTSDWGGVKLRQSALRTGVTEVGGQGIHRVAERQNRGISDS